VPVVGADRAPAKAADIVIQIAEELRSRAISLAVAHLEHSILELWTRAGAIDAIGGPDRVFETVREAVHALQASPATTAPATSSPRMGAVAPGGANR
jgi:hypothetical protein